MLTLSRSAKLGWAPFALIWSALGLIFATAARAYIHRYAIPFHATAAIYGCFMLLVALCLIPGFETSRAWARHRLVSSVPMLLCVPYVVYAAGTGQFQWLSLVRLFAIAGSVFAIYRFFPVSQTEKFSWQDLPVAIILIAAVLLHGLAGIWSRPVNLDFMGRLFLIGLGSWSWVFLRPVPKLGYRLALSWRAVNAAALNFGYFALIAIPSGFAMHFTAWNPRWHGVLAFCLDYLEIFLFIALLEELFFRGFLQTLIAGSLNSDWIAQAAVSGLFGFFHILHAPFPNWRYVALASVAGWFYGSAFRQAGNSVMASAMTHALVDTVWRTWLTRT